MVEDKRSRDGAYLLVRLVIAFALVVPAAAALVPYAAAADEDAILRIGFTQVIDNLNPTLGISDSAYVFYGLVYDSPQCVDDKLDPEPNLFTETVIVPASDPELVASGSPYGSVWEFTLTPNAMWHDGQPVTMDDALFSLNLFAEEYATVWTYQPYTYYMHYAEAVDDDTLRLYFFDRATLEPKAASYASVLGVPFLPEHLLGDESASYIVEEWDGTFADRTPPVVGTGPFMAGTDILEAWESGQPILLTRNPNYHWEEDKGKSVKIDGVELRFYSDSDAMSEALEEGVIDVAQLPPNSYASLKERIVDGSLEGLEAHDSLKVTSNFVEIGFNMVTGGFNDARLDPAVRKALALATDKEHIVDEYYLGLAEPGTTVISPVSSFWHYEPTASEKYAYNLALANEVLEDAGYRYPEEDSTVRVATADSLAVQMGWVEENTTLSFQMYTRSEYPEELETAAYLRNEWREIGVNMNYMSMSETELSELVYGFEYDLMLWYWSADTDPNFMLFCLTSMAWDGWSDTMYCNASYEENYTLCVSEMDPDARKTYTDNCQRIFYLDSAYIILAYPYQTYVWRTDRFTGWGDWSEDPGRSLDNFWTGNPLLFSIEPVDKGLDMLLVAGVGAGAAAAAAVGVFLFRRRRGERSGKT